MAYDVKYRRNGAKKWETIENIESDGFIPCSFGYDDKGRKVILGEMAVRFFYTADKDRVEISALEHEFRFPRKRYDEMVEREEKKAGGQKTFDR